MPFLMLLGGLTSLIMMIPVINEIPLIIIGIVIGTLIPIFTSTWGKCATVSMGFIIGFSFIGLASGYSELCIMALGISGGIWAGFKIKDLSFLQFKKLW